MINKYVFIGAAGTGKSETAINFAVELSKNQTKHVHFFDMDQTKPLFRSRELNNIFEKNKITLHAGKGLLDAPVVPHAVKEILEDDDNVAVLDVGGDVNGAVTLGQYEYLINRDNVEVYYMINCYRPFEGDKDSVRHNIEKIKSAANVKKIKIINNPNYGMITTSEDILKGYEIIKNYSEEINVPIEFLCVPNWLYDDISKKISIKILRITPYIKM